MISIKSTEEIELLRESNLLVSKTLGELAGMIAPGVTTIRLDRVAEEFLRDHHGVPGFLGYNGYPNTLCTSVNSQVVHGIPSDYRLEEGDIVTIDCGVRLNDFYGDSAYTFAVGLIDDKLSSLLRVTREALFEGLQEAREGKRTGDIGHAVQQYAENAGYSVVREMVGHGIGKQLHEEPEVPNYGRRGTGPRLRAGMCLCVEPMINMGDKAIVQQQDGWTITTRDNQPSAHFELAIAVSRNGPEVLSTFEYIEKKLDGLGRWHA